MPLTFRYKLSQIFLWAGTFILVWIFLILLFSVSLFFLNQHISPLNFWVPTSILFLGAAAVTIKIKSINKAVFGIGFAVFVISIILSIGLASLYYDNSWDGQDYQKKAIVKLSTGFNPIYQTAQPTDAYYNLSFNHYPKAPWIVETAIFMVTRDLEAGKGFNLMLVLCSFFITGAFLLTLDRLRLWQIILISGMAAFNPVSGNQIVNYYVDGNVGSTFIICGVLLVWLIKERSPLLLVALGFSIVIGVNIKFTGTAYIAILVACLLAYRLVKTRSIRKNTAIIATSILGALIGLGLIGYNPYMINTFRYGNPFYPVYGADESLNIERLMQGQLPNNMQNNNGIERFLKSIFSYSGNYLEGMTTVLKIPFTFQYREFRYFRAPDVRIGGFGIFFSGALILCILTFLFMAFRHSRYLREAVLISMLIILTVLINEQSWWARYVPQFWLILVVVLTVAWLENRKLVRISSYLLALAMAINLVFTAGPYFLLNARTTIEINSKLEAMEQSGQPYLIYVGNFTPLTFKLAQYHINYKLVDSLEELPCPNNIQTSIEYSPIQCP